MNTSPAAVWASMSEAEEILNNCDFTKLSLNYWDIVHFLMQSKLPCNKYIQKKYIYSMFEKHWFAIF